MYREFQPASDPFNLSVVIDRCVASDESDWAFPKNRSAGHAKAYNILLCCFRLSVVYHFNEGMGNCGSNLR